MAYIIGVDDVAKKVEDIAVGIDDTAHAVKVGYVGIDGVARKFYQRGYYEKRVYFFGYTGTLGTEYLTNKIYSVKKDGTDPIVYTLSDSIYAFYTSDSSYFPSYADYANIKPAKMYYDPKTQRLCVVGWNFPYIHFYVIDCKKNEIIEHKSYRPTTGMNARQEYAYYYNYEKGCVFFGCIYLGYLFLSCFNIRTGVLSTAQSSTQVSGRSFGMFATVNANDIARVVIGSNIVNIFDFDLQNNTCSFVSDTTLTNYYASTFIQPHSFFNKNQFGSSLFGVVFSYNSSASLTNTGYLVNLVGSNNSFSMRESANMVYRWFGFSNAHGAMWLQGNNGAYLGKYGTSYSETVNPIGALTNNSGRTYEGPVIGGGIITGYSNSNTAIIYANVSGSLYNITPQEFGAYNMPICEGVNLKEILIPGSNKFLVYDFNQAAYTTPISTTSASITPVPYTAVLTWSLNEQDSLVNLGY